MNNIEYISKKMCSACGACVSICPKNSITFKETSMGRIYAVADKTCINCGLCIKVCPLFNLKRNFEDYYSLEKLNIIIGKSVNNLYYKNGQSGGGVAAVLSMLFNMKKIDAALVCHSKKGVPYVVTHESELKEIQKSLYTAVPILAGLKEILEYKSVAIVGLPCHIQGITNFMKLKKIPIKYKLGLICDRQMCSTMASGIFKYYGLEKGEDTYIKWRDKTVGLGYNYQNAPLTVWHSDKMIGLIDKSVRLKFKPVFTYPSCLCCPNKLNLDADVVFGDPWNIECDGVNGESLIIMNNQEGQKLLTDAVKNNYLYVSKICTSEELDASQHIKERKGQVELYTKVLSKKSLTLDKEYLRALFNLYRFKILELFPKYFIKIYVKMKIDRLNRIRK